MARWTKRRETFRFLRRFCSFRHGFRIIQQFFSANDQCSSPLNGKKIRRLVMYQQNEQPDSKFGCKWKDDKKSARLSESLATFLVITQWPTAIFLPNVRRIINPRFSREFFDFSFWKTIRWFVIKNTRLLRNFVCRSKKYIGTI